MTTRHPHTDRRDLGLYESKLPTAVPAQAPRPTLGPTPCPGPATMKPIPTTPISVRHRSNMGTVSGMHEYEHEHSHEHSHVHSHGHGSDHDEHGNGSEHGNSRFLVFQTFVTTSLSLVLTRFGHSRYARRERLLVCHRHPRCWNGTGTGTGTGTGHIKNRVLVTIATVVWLTWWSLSSSLTRSSSSSSSSSSYAASELDFDLLVVGGGSGGLAVAKRAAGYGVRVGLVERDRLGGTCVNLGCVPKKVMWNAVGVAETLRDMRHYGFVVTHANTHANNNATFEDDDEGDDDNDASERDQGDAVIGALDWRALKDARDAYVHRLNGVYEQSLKSAGVVLLEGTATLQLSSIATTPPPTRRRSRSRTGTGTGTGTNPLTVTVKENSSPSSSLSYTAHHVVVATGGRPILPQFHGYVPVPSTSGSDHDQDYDQDPLVVTSDGFWDLKSFPHRTLVVGSGPVAVELASLLIGLDWTAQVSMVVRYDRILRNYEPTVALAVQNDLERKGVQFYFEVMRGESVSSSSSSSIQSLLVGGDEVVATLNDGRVLPPVDKVVVAVGRTPNLDVLSSSSSSSSSSAIIPKQTQTQTLPLLDQDPNDHGRIIVDEHSQTSVPGVYALGDICAGVPQLTPTAIAAGRRLADRLFGPKELKDTVVSYDLVPKVIFTHPPLATVGRTEAEAVDTYGQDRVVVYRSTFRNLYYGIFPPDDRPSTTVVLVCVVAMADTNTNTNTNTNKGRPKPQEEKPLPPPDTQTVVGLHVHGKGADELLQGFVVAMAMDPPATKADFDRALAVHPTAAEEVVTLHPWGKRKR